LLVPRNRCDLVQLIAAASRSRRVRLAWVGHVPYVDLENLSSEQAWLVTAIVPTSPPTAPDDRRLF